MYNQQPHAYYYNTGTHGYTQHSRGMREEASITMLKRFRKRNMRKMVIRMSVTGMSNLGDISKGVLMITKKGRTNDTNRKTRCETR